MNPKTPEGHGTTLGRENSYLLDIGSTGHFRHDPRRRFIFSARKEDLHDIHPLPVRESFQRDRWVPELHSGKNEVSCQKGPGRNPCHDGIGQQERAAIRPRQPNPPEGETPEKSRGRDPFYRKFSFEDPLCSAEDLSEDQLLSPKGLGEENPQSQRSDPNGYGQTKAQAIHAA